MMMKAKTGMMQLQARECQKLPANTMYEEVMRKNASLGLGRELVSTKPWSLGFQSPEM